MVIMQMTSISNPIRNDQKRTMLTTTIHQVTTTNQYHYYHEIILFCSMHEDINHTSNYTTSREPTSGERKRGKGTTHLLKRPTQGGEWTIQETRIQEKGREGLALAGTYLVRDESTIRIRGVAGTRTGHSYARTERWYTAMAPRMRLTPAGRA